MNLGTAEVWARTPPCGIQRMPPEPAALQTSQKRRGRLWPHMDPQMQLEAGHDVRRDAHPSEPGVGLGRPELQPPTDVVSGALDEDPAMQQIDVSPLEAQHFSQ